MRWMMHAKRHQRGRFTHFEFHLTTVAVFIPLVFMSGIAGAIFAAEAFAVTVGMLISYVTGIILLPVLYKVAYGKTFTKKNISGFFAKTQQKIDGVIFPLYDKGLAYVFRNKTLFYLLLIVSIPLCVLLFTVMPKSSMPHLDYVETIAMVEWNENIHVDENARRISEMLQSVKNQASENACYVGQRQYLLEKDNELTITEAQLYFKTEKSSQIAR